MNIVSKILLIFTCGASLSLNTYVLPSQPASAKFTPAQLSEDFQILRQALETGHSGIYRYQDKTALDKMFRQTADSLNAASDEYEFYRKLAPLVAAVECGHTSVRLPEAMRKELLTQTPLLPFQVKIIDGRAFIFRNFAAETENPAGKELVKINGVAVAEIIKTMLEATPSDAGIKTAKEWRLGNGWRFNINLISLLGIKSPYNLELRDTRRAISNLRTDGINLPELQKKWLEKYPQDQEKEQSHEPTASLKFLQNDQIALLKIGSFSSLVDAKRQQRLADFIRDSFSALKTKKSKSLIIDVRNNGGGDDDLGKLVLSYLLDKPFKYYDDLVINNLTFPFLKYAGNPDPIPPSFVERGADNRFHAVGHPNWGIQQPQPESFNGPVYVLINGGSFSTTAELLSHIRFHRRAVFIGEESGGGYYGNSSGFMPTLTLPNTRLELRIPLMTYYLAIPSGAPADHGVIPDHPVKPSIDDLIQDRDVSLNYAIKLASGD